MRIVHLSDIHLSKTNYEEFTNTYREALINDLLDFNRPKKIDVIVITGDLVDRGGHSLYEIEDFKDKSSYPCPYTIFEEVFITPIADALKLSKENFLFIPGNHDVDESGILLKEEYDLTKALTPTNVDDYLKENLAFQHSKRIRVFKEFEERFHIGQTNYQYSNNQSVYSYTYEGINVGFILVNDSWRCRSQRFENEDGLMFGANQLHRGIRDLEKFDTQINIALLHHPIEEFREREELKQCLNNSNISLYLFGHSHNSKFEKQYNGSKDNCLGIRGRASLNKINEKLTSYTPGFQIIDLELKFSIKITEIHYRQYISPLNHFDYDPYAHKNGIDKGVDGKGIEIYVKSPKKTMVLPNKELFKS